MSQIIFEPLYPYLSEGEMAGWHHWRNGHEPGQTGAAGEGQGGLACCSSWVAKSWALLSNGTTAANLICKLGLLNTYHIAWYKGLVNRALEILASHGHVRSLTKWFRSPDLFYSKEVSRTIKHLRIQDSAQRTQGCSSQRLHGLCKVGFQVPGMAEKREHSSHPKGETGAQLAVGSKASGYVSVDFKDHHVCPIGQQESLSLQTGRMTDGQCWPDSGQAPGTAFPTQCPQGVGRSQQVLGAPGKRQWGWGEGCGLYAAESSCTSASVLPCGSDTILPSEPEWDDENIPPRGIPTISLRWMRSK